MNITEYPYNGTITRTISTQDENGDTNESQITIYTGVMDYTINTAEIGSLAQTSDCIISMPLTIDTNNKYILPDKKDEITCNVYGENIILIVNNYEVSQLGGVTIYANRGII